MQKPRREPGLFCVRCAPGTVAHARHAYGDEVVPAAGRLLRAPARQGPPECPPAAGTTKRPQRSSATAAQATTIANDGHCIGM